MFESRRTSRWLIGICTLAGTLPFVSCVSVAVAQDGDPEAVLEAAALDYVKAIDEGRVEQIRTGRVMLGYGVDPASPAIAGAELFYTTDEGRMWTEAALVNPLANPIAFDADEDGLYGFVFVLHSENGSMPRPQAGTVPHRWVMVDRGAPQIAIREFHAQEAGLSDRDVSIGWLVTDANNNLGVRPVTISYRPASDGLTDVRVIARGLEAQGEHRWTIPLNISGDLVLRVEAEDRAGNRDYLETRTFAVEAAVKSKSQVHINQTVSLASAQDGGETSSSEDSPVEVASAPEKSQPDAVVSAFDLLNASASDEIAVEKEAAERAKREYDLATWHRMRGEHEIAIRRYRDALAAHPEYYQARNDLAGTLLALNRIDEAAHEYERILEKDDRYAPALEGLALVQIKRRRYRSAHDTLARLLRERPNDPEAWLHFGDVCMFMGDRRGAREAWHTAVQSDRAVASLKSRAQRRLAIYQRDRLGAVD